MVCSLLSFKKFEKIDELSVATGWLTRESRTQVVEFVEMTAWILRWAWWMLAVGVGCWWLWVTSRQNDVRRTAATQFEPSSIRDSLYVSQSGEC